MTPSGESALPARHKWLVRAAFGGCMAFNLLAASAFGGQRQIHSMSAAMFNNVFLAYIPVELSLHISRFRGPVVFWTLLAAWMLFYPNAPYVLTDYFHLAYVDPYIVLENGRRTALLRQDTHLWLSFTILSLSALFSSLLGTWSMDRTVRQVQARLRRPGAWWRILFVSTATCLSSVGIYLGRFPRLHSVDMLTRPRHAIAQAAQTCRPDTLEFVLLLTLVQMALWGCLLVLRTVSRQEPAAIART